MQLHLLNGAVTQDKQHYNEERNYLPIRREGVETKNGGAFNTHSLQ